MIAIQNFGFLWERKYIDFGKQGVPGTLLGFRLVNKYVDFREQSGVYILYDDHKLPVYVGQAAKLFDRLKTHAFNDRLWNRWEFFSWFGLRKVNVNGTLHAVDSIDKKLSGTVKNALDEIEGVLVQILEPKLNRRGPTWRDVEEYFQARDEEEIYLEDIYEEQVELKKQIEKLKKKLS